MNKEKLLNVIEGIVLVVLGIMVAINGWGAMDTYFGIVGIVSGAAMIVLALFTLSQTKALPFSILALGGVVLTLGIALVCKRFSLGVVVALFVWGLIGFGSALVLYGLYTTLVRKEAVYGICQIVVGALLITLSILFINVPDFQKAFWIIVGIVIAIFGALLIVLQFVDKKQVSKK